MGESLLETDWRLGHLESALGHLRRERENGLVGGCDDSRRLERDGSELRIDGEPSGVLAHRVWMGVSSASRGDVVSPELKM